MMKRAHFAPLAIAVVAIFAAALPAAAQTEVTHQQVSFDLSGTNINLCNGEVVQITEGECRAHITRYFYADGTTRGTLNQRCSAKGIGSYGNLYVMQDKYFSRTDNGCPTGGDEYSVMRDHGILVSQGSDDNRAYRVTIEFYYPGCDGPPQVVVDGEAECRG